MNTALHISKPRKKAGLNHALNAWLSRGLWPVNQAEIFTAVVQHSSSDSIMEIGCENGLLVERLRLANFRTVAYESDPVLIEQAIEAGVKTPIFQSGVTHEQLYRLETDLKFHRVGTVVVRECIEHVLSGDGVWTSELVECLRGCGVRQMIVKPHARHREKVLSLLVESGLHQHINPCLTSAVIVMGDEPR